MSVFLYLLVYLGCLFLGAYWISGAIKRFLQKEYFMFGFNIMSGLYIVMLLVRLAFHL